MSTSIPAAAREHVKGRFRDACARCGVGASQGHWHHRRSRSVRDEHQHCPCNGVWLCATCHEWVHKNPFEARRLGMIVSRAVTHPGTVEVYTFVGAMVLDCNGLFTFISQK